MGPKRQGLGVTRPSPRLSLSIRMAQEASVKCIFMKFTELDLIFDMNMILAYQPELDEHGAVSRRSIQLRSIYNRSINNNSYRLHQY